MASQAKVSEKRTTRALFPCVTRGSGWRCAARRPAAASASRTTHARSCPSRPPPSEPRQLWRRKVATQRGGGKRRGKWGARGSVRKGERVDALNAGLDELQVSVDPAAQRDVAHREALPSCPAPAPRTSDPQTLSGQKPSRRKAKRRARTKVGPVGKDLLVDSRPLLGDGLGRRRQRPHVPVLRSRPDDLPASTEG